MGLIHAKNLVEAKRLAKKSVEAFNKSPSVSNRVVSRVEKTRREGIFSFSTRERKLRSDFLKKRK